MLYISWVVILGDHDFKKISFENLQFLAARGEKLHKQVVYLSLASLGLVAANSRLHASFTFYVRNPNLVRFFQKNFQKFLPKFFPKFVFKNFSKIFSKIATHGFYNGIFGPWAL